MTLSYKSAMEIRGELVKCEIGSSIIDSMNSDSRCTEFTEYDLCTLIIRLSNSTVNIHTVCSILDKYSISCSMDIIDNKIVLH